MTWEQQSLSIVQEEEEEPLQEEPKETHPLIGGRGSGSGRIPEDASGVKCGASGREGAFTTVGDFGTAGSAFGAASLFGANLHFPGKRLCSLGPPC